MIEQGGEQKPTSSRSDDSIEKIPLFVMVQRMTVAERMQFARRTDKEGRGLLIRDSNKQIALATLANPKLTIQEVEQFAKSRQLSSDLLREIAGNVEWMKHYNVVVALASNPKTPLPLALKLLPRVKTKDLAFLSKDRNMSNAIRSTALRMYKARSER
jgi:hypothetical protein